MMEPFENNIELPIKQIYKKRIEIPRIYKNEEELIKLIK